MGIIGNNFRLNTGVHRSIGDVMARTNGNMQRYSSFCNTRSQMGNGVVYSLVASPVGSNSQSSFYPPQTAGGMSLRIISSGGLSATLIPERLMEVDFTGSGDLNGIASLTVGMLCAMTGSGTMMADIAGILNATVDFTGQGNLTADVNGIGNMIIDLLGQGDLDAVIAGYGDMSIDITVTGAGLSTANVGQAVWTAILSQFSADPNSAAAKLLGASSAGDPWSTDLPGSYTGDQAGVILSQIQALVDELHKIQGLDVDNPLIVTPTTRDSGPVQLNITGDGVTNTTVTRVP